MLPFIHNLKYGHTSNYLLRTLVEQHQEPSEWKSKVLAHIEQELDTITEITKLEGLLEWVENNFA